jgi:hypothetical protein
MFTNISWNVQKVSMNPDENKQGQKASGKKSRRVRQKVG